MSAAASLAVGQGPCACTARLDLRFAADALQMEAGPDLLSSVLAAVHRVNRRAGEERIALDLPGADSARPGFDRIGRLVRLFGSAELLAALLADDRFAGLLRSGKMLAAGGVQPVIAAPGPGRLLVRDQGGAKSTPAGLARAKRRLERRGGTWVEREHRGAGLPAAGSRHPFLQVGDRKLAFGVRLLPFSGPVLVSTYGLGASDAVAGLPAL